MSCKNCKDCKCKNIVLIPCYRRAEFLFYNIELIKLSSGAEKYKYVFALDFGYDETCVEIIKNSMPYEYEIIYTPYKGYQGGKQSHNVLHNLCTCANNCKRVILLEDDVMISNRFFEWHEQAWLTAPDAFAHVGSKNANNNDKVSGKLNECYIASGCDYQGIGTSYNSELILKHVAEHDKKDYYVNLVGYCSRRFPDTVLNKTYTEQDGLIRRVIEQNGLKVIYPHFPVCYHAGFYGKNRGKYLKKPLHEKIEEIGNIIFDSAAMKNNCLHEEWFVDSEPTQLMGLPEITKIMLVDAN